MAEGFWFEPPPQWDTAGKLCFYLALIEDAERDLAEARNTDQRQLAEYGLESAHSLMDEFCDKHEIQDWRTWQPPRQLALGI